MKAFSLIYAGTEFSSPQKRGTNKQRPPLKGNAQTPEETKEKPTSSTSFHDRHEIMALLRSQRPDYTEKKLEALYKLVDPSGSGRVSRKNCKVVLAALEKQAQRAHPPPQSTTTPGQQAKSSDKGDDSRAPLVPTSSPVSPPLPSSAVPKATTSSARPLVSPPRRRATNGSAINTSRGMSAAAAAAAKLAQVQSATGAPPQPSDRGLPYSGGTRPRVEPRPGFFPPAPPAVAPPLPPPSTPGCADAPVEAPSAQARPPEEVEDAKRAEGLSRGSGARQRRGLSVPPPKRPAAPPSTSSSSSSSRSPLTNRFSEGEHQPAANGKQHERPRGRSVPAAAARCCSQRLPSTINSSGAGASADTSASQPLGQPLSQCAEISALSEAKAALEAEAAELHKYYRLRAEARALGVDVDEEEDEVEEEEEEEKEEDTGSTGSNSGTSSSSDVSSCSEEDDEAQAQEERKNARRDGKDRVSVGDNNNNNNDDDDTTRDENKCGRPLDHDGDDGRRSRADSEEGGDWAAIGRGGSSSSSSSITTTTIPPPPSTGTRRGRRVEQERKRKLHGLQEKRAKQQQQQQQQFAQAGRASLKPSGWSNSASRAPSKASTTSEIASQLHREILLDFEALKKRANLLGVTDLRGSYLDSLHPPPGVVDDSMDCAVRGTAASNQSSGRNSQPQQQQQQQQQQGEKKPEQQQSQEQQEEEGEEKQTQQQEIPPSPSRRPLLPLVEPPPPPSVQQQPLVGRSLSAPMELEDQEVVVCVPPTSRSRSPPPLRPPPGRSAPAPPPAAAAASGQSPRRRSEGGALSVPQEAQKQPHKLPHKLQQGCPLQQPFSRTRRQVLSVEEDTRVGGAAARVAPENHHHRHHQEHNRRTSTLVSARTSSYSRSSSAPSPKQSASSPLSDDDEQGGECGGGGGGDGAQSTQAVPSKKATMLHNLRTGFRSTVASGARAATMSFNGGSLASMTAGKATTTTTTTFSSSPSSSSSSSSCSSNRSDDDEVLEPSPPPSLKHSSAAEGGGAVVVVATPPRPPRAAWVPGGGATIPAGTDDDGAAAASFGPGPSPSKEVSARFEALKVQISALRAELKHAKQSKAELARRLEAEVKRLEGELCESRQQLHQAQQLVVLAQHQEHAHRHASPFPSPSQSPPVPSSSPSPSMMLGEATPQQPQQQQQQQQQQTEGEEATLELRTHVVRLEAALAEVVAESTAALQVQKRELEAAHATALARALAATERRLEGRTEEAIERAVASALSQRALVTDDGSESSVSDSNMTEEEEEVGAVVDGPSNGVRTEQLDRSVAPSIESDTAPAATPPATAAAPIPPSPPMSSPTPTPAPSSSWSAVVFLVASVALALVTSLAAAVAQGVSNTFVPKALTLLAALHPRHALPSLFQPDKGSSLRVVSGEVPPRLRGVANERGGSEDEGSPEEGEATHLSSTFSTVVSLLDFFDEGNDDVPDTPPTPPSATAGGPEEGKGHNEPLVHSSHSATKQQQQQQQRDGAPPPKVGGLVRKGHTAARTLGKGPTAAASAAFFLILRFGACTCAAALELVRAFGRGCAVGAAWLGKGVAAVAAAAWEVFRFLVVFATVCGLGLVGGVVLGGPRALSTLLAQTSLQPTPLAPHTGGLSSGEWVPSPFRTSLVLGHDGALRVLQGFPGDDDCYTVWSSPSHRTPQSQQHPRRRRAGFSGGDPSGPRDFKQNLTAVLAAAIAANGEEAERAGVLGDFSAASSAPYRLTRVEGSGSQSGGGGAKLVITWYPGRLRRPQQIWKLDLNATHQRPPALGALVASTTTSSSSDGGSGEGESQQTVKLAPGGTKGTAGDEGTGRMIPPALAPWLGTKRISRGGSRKANSLSLLPASSSSSSSPLGPSDGPPRSVLWSLAQSLGLETVWGAQEGASEDESSSGGSEGVDVDEWSFQSKALPPVWVEALAVGAADLIHTLHHPLSPKRNPTPLTLLRPPVTAAAASSSPRAPPPVPSGSSSSSSSRSRSSAARQRGSVVDWRAGRARAPALSSADEASSSSSTLPPPPESSSQESVRREGTQEQPENGPGGKETGHGRLNDKGAHGAAPPSSPPTPAPTATVALAKAVAALGLSPGSSNPQTSVPTDPVVSPPAASASEVAYRAAMKLGAGAFIREADSAGERASVESAPGGPGGGGSGANAEQLRSREALLWEVLPKVLGERAREKRLRTNGGGDQPSE